MLEESVKSKYKVIKATTPQRKAHVRYRAKRSMEYQRWSTWTVGLEYTALVMAISRMQLLKSWRIRFPEKHSGNGLRSQDFYTLCALRLFMVLTTCEKADIRMVAQFMKDNKLIGAATPGRKKELIYRSFNSLQLFQFIVPVGRNANYKHPRIYALTNRAKLLFKEHDMTVKDYFRRDFVFAPERPNKRSSKKITPDLHVRNIEHPVPAE